MSFEYKIIADLSDADRSQIIEIIESNPLLYSQYEDYGNPTWEYKSPDNDDFLPDTSITLEKDGIYICQYIVEDTWHELQGIEQYLTEKSIAYTIEVEEPWDEEDEEAEEEV